MFRSIKKIELLNKLLMDDEDNEVHVVSSDFSGNQGDVERFLFELEKKGVLSVHDQDSEYVYIGELGTYITNGSTFLVEVLDKSTLRRESLALQEQESTKKDLELGQIKSSEDGLLVVVREYLQEILSAEQIEKLIGRCQIKKTKIALSTILRKKQSQEKKLSIQSLTYVNGVLYVNNNYHDGLILCERVGRGGEKTKLAELFSVLWENRTEYLSGEVVREGNPVGLARILKVTGYSTEDALGSGIKHLRGKLHRLNGIQISRRKKSCELIIYKKK